MTSHDEQDKQADDDVAVMAALREAARVEHGPVPQGYELVAVPDPEWRVDSGKLCRRALGWGKLSCGKRSVAARRRGHEEYRSVMWWGYCPDHMYGKWIEGGQVMHWIIREKQPADGAR